MTRQGRFLTRPLALLQAAASTWGALPHLIPVCPAYPRGGSPPFTFSSQSLSDVLSSQPFLGGSVRGEPELWCIVKTPSGLIYLSICLSVCVCISLFTSVHLPFCLSCHQSTAINTPIPPFIYLFICLHIFCPHCAYLCILKERTYLHISCPHCAYLCILKERIYLHIFCLHCAYLCMSKERLPPLLPPPLPPPSRHPPFSNPTHFLKELVTGYLFNSSPEGR